MEVSLTSRDGRSMINRITLINDLESFLNECFNTINDLVLKQQIKQTDARVTFFKHLVNVVDPTILSLILSHKYLGNKYWWIQTQKDYNLSNDQSRLTGNSTTMIN